MTNRGLILTVLAVAIVVVAALVWNAGATISRLREHAYPIPSTQCHQGKDCEQRALEIQAREAITSDNALDVSVGQLALSILGFGGIGFTVYYAHLAWREARASAGTAREAFEADHRAKMEITNVDILPPGLKWIAETGDITFVVHAKNVGRESAISAWIDLRLHIDLTIQVATIRDEMIEQAVKTPAAFGHLVFASAPLDLQISLSITPADIATLKENMTKAFGPDLPDTPVLFTHLIGVITYFPREGMARRHTAFVLELRQANGLALQAYKDAARENLSLIRSPLSDMVAN